MVIFERLCTLGYIPIEPGETDSELLSSRYEVEIAGEKYAAQASQSQPTTHPERI